VNLQEINENVILRPMADRGYFFVDGSTLFNHIKLVQKHDSRFKGRPLHLSEFTDALFNSWGNFSGPAVRLSLYFKKHDKRLGEFLYVPKSNTPEAKNHWEIIECGYRNPYIPKKELEKISDRWRDHVIPAEKGLDMKLACDVLSLVANNKATAVVLYINDVDYLPLIEASKNLGSNVYLTCLFSKNPIQTRLCDKADKFLTLDNYLESIFQINKGS
jgi:uncharacterized LabA/DUF88 family protein